MFPGVSTDKITEALERKRKTVKPPVPKVRSP